MAEIGRLNRGTSYKTQTVDPRLTRRDNRARAPPRPSVVKNAFITDLFPETATEL